MEIFNLRTLKSTITVKDLAKLCGVSRGTIDRALNNRSGINEKTKKRILEAAKSYNFIKNQNASALSSGKSHLIGVIVFALNNEFFSTLVSSIENKARQLGYSVIIMLSGYDYATELQCAESLAAMNVSGLVVCSVLNDAAPYKRLVSRGNSVITVVNRIEGLPFVGIDDSAAMYEGARYVIMCGYEKIVYIAPVLSKRSMQNMSAQVKRHDGFIKAMKDCCFKNYLIIDNYADYTKVLPQLKNEKSCAVVCSSDIYTIECVAELKNTAVGIMGFDRLKVLETLYPMQSGVQCPTESIGEHAVQLLVTRDFANEKIDDVILPHHIIYGNSIRKMT